MNPVSFQASPYLQALRADPKLAGAGAVPDSAPIVQPAELEMLSGTPRSTGALPQAGASFENVLSDMVRDVNARQAAASEKIQGLLSGQGVPLHQAVIAAEEASVSFQLMVEVRNKLLESYQELMRMQI